MPGPLQYGPGIVACAVHLLCAQMVPLKRTAAMIRAMTGRLLSEATLLGFVARLHKALDAWEEAAIRMLLEMPVLNVDEIGIIPRYGGVIVHDCWKAYLTYTNCRHQLCGAHLLRELQAVTDSNGRPWAERMRKLLLIARRQVMRRPDRRLSMRQYRRIARCYREILEQGRKEMPEIPKREKGRRGPVAKSDAHNLLERLAAQRRNVLRFTRRADTPFSNNRAERDFRMAKVKQKVSGCFRTVAFAHAYCRISSYLKTMAALGYNPLVAITIALQGKAVACLDQDA